MPTFSFKGRNYENGEVITGERFAPNPQALAAALRSERVMPIQIGEKKEAGQGVKLSLPTKNVGSKDMALFARQFSVMLDAGLPLVQCLSILADQQEKKVFRDTLRQVRSDVEAGATLADAMRKHPRTFDDLFVSMIQAGEAGGILDIILERLSVFLEKIVKLRRGVISASVYPAIVISVAVIIVFVIMIFVIPVFATLFEGMGTSLPLPTRIVMKISSLLSQFIIPLLILGAIGAFGFRQYYQTTNGRKAIDRVKLGIPIIGTVIRKLSIARFSRTLSTLLSSGIPILEGLQITADTAGNVIVKDALLNARREVEEGKTLAEPMKKVKVFPSMVTQIIAVGEQTGELDQMLTKLADYYEDEADAAVANMLTMIEPVMIVFLGVVIGGIVVSMYLPIFTLIGNMSAGM
ncbi:MAG TPA: type II secretion system F family protein [Acidobacteriota bacterium]|nr:type II secretion system F family protein [Acidobacteriota bacterium]